jgi:zinc transporter ZupT
LPLTAGGFLYIAGADLIPELQHGTDVKFSTAFWQFTFIILGIFLMFLLALLE